MKGRYHFSNGIGDQSMGKTKKQITLHIDKDAIACFKNQAADTGISYQNLINLYLRDCVANESSLLGISRSPCIYTLREI